jgi:5'-hydroxyaverantin dehydrogenase
MASPTPITTQVDLSKLKGKTAIVTGGASGLGLATAEKWAANGAYVTIADVNDAQGQKAVEKITSNGGKAQYVHCDVLSWESSNEAFKSAVNFGPSKTLDISALYAGVLGTANNMVDVLKANGPPSLESTPPVPTHKAIDVNLTGEWYSTYLSFHYMQLKPETGGAANGASAESKKSIVMIASLAGYVDYPNNSAYAAGKFGVRGLWRSIRSRAPELGVRTNLIAPWFVDTPMVADMKAELVQAGVKWGQGFTWAPADNVVEAATKCAVEDDVDGEYFEVPVGTITT